MQHSTQVLCIVIGASAGGIDALMRLLPALPADLQAPVCVVLHLPPQGESLLAQIFADRCKLAVKEVEDGEPLLPGTIYFAPANYHFLIEAGPRVALNVDEPVNYSRPSIDLLFESAADVFGFGACGALLSGSNSDGAAGLEKIHAAGGRTFIQDPAESQASAMPFAALALMPGHPVTRMDEMAAALSAISSARTA
jgi:two-component system, chemotaxis family, protein-glutamate methylesterase/glutaminase